MIKYRLICKDCETTFDSWFSSSKEYERLKKKNFILKGKKIQRGNPTNAILKSKNYLKGNFTTGSQEHFYLEGQVAFVIPKEDKDLLVYSSTQHP